MTCKPDFTGAKDAQRRQLDRFASLLLDAGGKQNLFSRRGNPQDVISCQIGSSLRSQFLVTLLSPMRVLDLGSGGGFPGIPLAIVNPTICFTLLDSSAKKARHLSHAIGELGLRNAKIMCGRAEDLGMSVSHKFGYDLILAKAVSEPLSVARLAKPMLAPQGVVLLYIGEDRRKGWENLFRRRAVEEGMVIRAVDAGTGERERTRICLLSWGHLSLGESVGWRPRRRRYQEDSLPV